MGHIWNEYNIKTIFPPSKRTFVYLNSNVHSYMLNKYSRYAHDGEKETVASKT